MRNRAKCKLCNSIIESFHERDYVTCKCGEISIDGGLYKLWTHANNYENFLRVDDEDNEIMVKYIKESENEKTNTQSQKIEAEPPRLSRQDMLRELETMIKYDENLPANAMHAPIIRAELNSYMMLVLAIFKEKE